VDEQKAVLKRAGVSVIDDRRPDQQPAIQFSNFSLLENRETHVLELYLTPIGGEPGDWRNADCYRYTVAIPRE